MLLLLFAFILNSYVLTPKVSEAPHGNSMTEKFMFYLKELSQITENLYQGSIYEGLPQFSGS